MAITGKKLFNPIAIGVAVSTAYTVPAATTTTVQALDVVNTTGSTKLLRIFFVPSGGVAGTGNALVYDVPIPKNSTFPWRGPQVLSTGDTIQTQADAVGLTLHGTGLEVG